ncbi:hypothetical protein ES708_09381 [subsurface metagenome]
MTILSAVITLILVMDPFGGIPVFLSLLQHIPAKRRRIVILREMTIALCILALFLFFGKYILSGLRISEPALNISGGGVILFLIALLILLFADLIRKLLGHRVIQAIERLMGMILTTMAVQMLLSGVREFLLSLQAA